MISGKRGGDRLSPGRIVAAERVEGAWGVIDAVESAVNLGRQPPGFVRVCFRPLNRCVGGRGRYDPVPCRSPRMLSVRRRRLGGPIAERCLLNRVG